MGQQQNEQSAGSNPTQLTESHEKSHAWRRLMPLGSNSSIRRRTLVENMHGSTRRAPRNKLRDVAERWRFVPQLTNSVPAFCPMKSKPKNTLKHNVLKNFVQASNRKETPSWKAYRGVMVLRARLGARPEAMLQVRPHPSLPKVDDTLT